MIVRRAIKVSGALTSLPLSNADKSADLCLTRFQNDSIVAGGGAIEMELSKYLRDYSRTIPGKQQLLIGAYAKALEVIPRQLCDNAGFDATNILNKLRAKHAQVGDKHTHTLS